MTYADDFASYAPVVDAPIVQVVDVPVVTYSDDEGSIQAKVVTAAAVSADPVTSAVGESKEV